MLQLDDELRQQVERAGEARVTDPDTRREYVVVRAEVYDKMRRLLEEVDPSLYEFDDRP
jgi:hypothetical protein